MPQRGHFEERGRWLWVRFWTPGENGKRRLTSVKVCPLEGPGALRTKPEKQRRALQIIGETLGSRAVEPDPPNAGTTFEEQAERWLALCETRHRKPVSQHTLKNWRSHLNKHINPTIGSVPIALLNNREAKVLVAKLVADGLSPNSIRDIFNVVKLAMAWEVDPETGERKFPRHWNSDFLDLPMIVTRETPAFDRKEVEAILRKATGWKTVLYALLAGSGLRIGEALGLRAEDVTNDFRTLRIRRSLWEGQIRPPKTAAGIREVDLPKPLAELLKRFLAGRREGWVFGNGQPVSSQSSLLKRGLHPVLKKAKVPKQGFHGFRRFRASVLRKAQAPENLIRFWLGHSGETVTDRYDRTRDDLAHRLKWADRVGLGFDAKTLRKTRFDTLGTKKASSENRPI